MLKKLTRKDKFHFAEWIIGQILFPLLVMSVVGFIIYLNGSWLPLNKMIANGSLALFSGMLLINANIQLKIDNNIEQVNFRTMIFKQMCIVFGVLIMIFYGFNTNEIENCNSCYTTFPLTSKEISLIWTNLLSALSASLFSITALLSSYNRTHKGLSKNA